MTPEKERKNKRIGMAVSLGVHVAVLLLFAFLMAWTAPDPPLPEYGIELNFGTSDAGTGNIQPPIEATPAESEDEAKPEELPEVVEEDAETQEIPVEDTQTETESESTEQVQEVFEDEQSADVVKEVDKVQEEVKEIEEKEEPPKELEEQEEIEKPIEKVEKTEKVVDTGAEGKDGEKKVTDANQGDKTDKIGDQGDEKGTIDSRALYGTPGGGGGSALLMAGWQWDVAPKPDDTTSETGKIVFEITIDDEGYIISIKTIESSVIPSVKKIYEDEVRSLSFSKTDNLPPAPTSKGRITFIIKAK